MLITDALVLRRSDYRDYDRMVTLLSPTMGRIEAIVRGCKKPRSPLMNAAEPFCAGEYTIISTKGRASVTGCQIHESFYNLRGDYDRLVHGAYYLHLLLLAALPEQPCGELFHLGLRALAHLNYGALPPELVTAAFEMHYMALLGQSPRVDECVRCGRPMQGVRARFDEALGGAVCEGCATGGYPLSEGARRILLKAPRVRFDACEKLEDRPEWPEAAAHIRRFVSYRIEQFPRQLPELYTGEKI